jgi:EAL domain-containing protein (putative c-di-GMP-specific phosphodiesterase class I)/CheY-like chemotaxis protein
LNASPVEGRRPTADTPADRLILLVDDDPVYRSVCASILESAGLATVEAESGARALALAAEHRFDAVLIDQVMPAMSGVELTTALRRQPLHLMTPLMFVSADDDAGVRLEALRAGATDFMVKPVEPDEMVARVQSQLVLAAQWETRFDNLRARAATVSDIASMMPAGSPSSTAKEICRRISRSNGGRGVAILSWEEDPIPMAATGSPAFLEDTPVVTLPPRSRSGPWIHYSLGNVTGRRGWSACAPVQFGRAPIGVLVLEGGEAPQEEMLATAVDYAATAAIHLGPVLTQTRRDVERRQAVEDNLRPEAFEPVFQPVIDLRNAAVVGHEALTRLTSGLPIIEFLADADDARLRAECELTFLRAALDEAGALPPGTWLSVNLSPSILLSHTADLAQLLSRSTRRIVIELTENERIEDYAAVRHAVAQLGPTVRLSVDDTGSGYASLRHVVDLRPHYLKLDRSWITGVEVDETRQALIAGIVGFCDHTGTELIAEGIERLPERQTLESLGVVYGQGYLLGRPQPLH